MGPNWPMGEFWGDKIAPLRKTLEEFIERPLRQALDEKKQKELRGGKVDEEGETLLSNLVQETQGWLSFCFSLVVYRIHVDTL